MTTDTKTAKIPEGSYVLNYGASKTYPWMKQVASMFNADNQDMSNSQNTILTNNEIYLPPEGVEAIGVEKLEYMNNKPKEGAHDSINNLMVMNTLSGLKPMYGGGEVKPMMEYNKGGMVKKKKMMGYQDGGAVQDNTVSNLMNLLALGEISNQRPEMSMYDADTRGGVMGQGDPLGISEGNFMPTGAAIGSLKKLFNKPEFFTPSVINKPLEAALIKNKASKKDLSLVRNLIEENEAVGMSLPERGEEIFSQLNSLFKKIAKNKTELNKIYEASGAENLTTIYPEGELLKSWQKLRQSNIDEMFPKNRGGMVGYQDGNFVGPPQTSQNLADDQNRQLSESIDRRMANPNIYKGSPMGVVRDNAMMLQDSIKQDIENKAIKTLQLMKLKGMLNDPQSINMQEPPIPNNAIADSMRMRDLLEFVKMQSMNRGAPAVMQGMGSESMEDLR